MTVPMEEFDLPFEDTWIHCYELGTGPAVIMLHGSGAGTSTMSNFRAVLDDLADEFHVLAADLVGFGFSGYKSTPPYFDMDLWCRQVASMADRLSAPWVVVVGHSLGGAIALKAAARDRRVAGVLTTGTIGLPAAHYSRGPRWSLPSDADAVRAAISRTVWNQQLVIGTEVERRLRVLARPGYREYYSEMFQETPAHYLDRSAITEEEFDAVECPVLLMHGMEDATSSPQEGSLEIASRLRHADAFVLRGCAHSVALERPEDFIAGLRRTVARARTHWDKASPAHRKRARAARASSLHDRASHDGE